MTVTITVRCDNAAFHDENGPWPGPELARILRELAGRVEWESEREVPVLTVFDVNGNRVGNLVPTQE